MKKEQSKEVTPPQTNSEIDWATLMHMGIYIPTPNPVPVPKDQPESK